MKYELRNAYYLYLNRRIFNWNQITLNIWILYENMPVHLIMLYFTLPNADHYLYVLDKIHL